MTNTDTYNSLKWFLPYLIIMTILFIPVFTMNIRQCDGQSMNPTIQDGDYIVIKESDRSKLLLGHIIVFEHEGTKTTCHRVVEDSGFILITKGDNNNVNDKPITRNQVIGEVTNIIPSLVFNLYIAALIISCIANTVIAAKIIVYNLKKT